MKKIIIFASLILQGILHAQNLVPNPSFEEYEHCPTGVPDLDGNLKYWKSFRGTPDYFNKCSGIIGFHNPWGYQQAHTGRGYVGLGGYQGTILNLREHLGVQLTSPLIIGTKYYISFFTSCAYTYLYINIATNKIGALVTTYQYYDPYLQKKLPNFCTLYSDSIIKDTINWIKIFGSFIADSTYKYLVIGNFFDDKQIDTLHLPYQVVPQSSLYYIDDVCLSTDSIYCQNWTGIREIINDKTKILVFPNPTPNEVNIKSENKIKLIQIMNSLGELVFSNESFNNKQIKLSLNFLNPNTYYLKIITTKDFYFTKLNIIY